MVYRVNVKGEEMPGEKAKRELDRQSFLRDSGGGRRGESSTLLPGKSVSCR
jgi:hypothetical protein